MPKNSLYANDKCDIQNKYVTYLDFVQTQFIADYKFI